MRSLIAYYSRTGKTKRVAEAISDSLGADIEEIIDIKNRDGIRGFLLAAKDSVTKRFTQIKPTQRDPALYDLVIVGSPVWAFTVTPAIRTYLAENKDRFKKIAFFCTQDSAGAGRAFKVMERLCAKRPEATLELTAEEITKEKYIIPVKEFIRKIRGQ